LGQSRHPDILIVDSCPQGFRGPLSDLLRPPLGMCAVSWKALSTDLPLRVAARTDLAGGLLADHEENLADVGAGLELAMGVGSLGKGKGPVHNRPDLP
jgi:hypothetical protein